MADVGSIEEQILRGESAAKVSPGIERGDALRVYADVMTRHCSGQSSDGRCEHCGQAGAKPALSYRWQLRHGEKPRLSAWTFLTIPAGIYVINVLRTEYDFKTHHCLCPGCKTGFRMKYPARLALKVLYTLFGVAASVVLVGIAVLPFIDSGATLWRQIGTYVFVSAGLFVAAAWLQRQMWKLEFPRRVRWLARTPFWLTGRSFT